ncbi:MAG: hypothetical protein Q9211_003960 [Gyalolechia sp. 1 TL-2023]
MAQTSTILRESSRQYLRWITLICHSEKARIPAWCDRIIKKGSNLKQIDYATAPLRFSDHRPVYATFECTINNIDESRKEDLSRVLYEKRKQDIAGSTADRGKSDEDLVNPIAAGLPPASSDRRKWWLDRGLPARSQAQPPRNNVVLNPARPSNPFTATTEPDWVMVVRSQEARNSGGKIDTPPTPPSRRGTRISPTSNGHPAAHQGAPDLAPKHGVSASKEQIGSLSPSKASDVLRKPAPPVPKKPAVLSTSSAGPDTPQGRARGESKPSTTDQHSNGSRTRVGKPDTTIPTPPPRPRQTDPGVMAPKVGAVAGTRKTSPNARRLSERQRPPSAPITDVTPSRRGEVNSSRRDLLEEDNVGAGAIPSLQPLRPS